MSSHKVRATKLSWSVDIGAAGVVMGVFWAPNLVAVEGGQTLLIGIILVALASTSMVLRWLQPMPSAIVAFLATGAGWALGLSDDPMLAFAWCLYPVALNSRSRTGLPGTVPVTIVVAASLFYGGRTALDFVEQILISGIAVIAAWLLGHVEVQRTEALRREIHLQAETKRTRQQTEMARDVHDVVGHALSVICAEAGTSRILPGLAESELRASLGDIELRARGSLEEVQALVRSLRNGSSALRTSQSIQEIVSAARVSGLHVTSRLDLPDYSDEIATRVIQEALSNVVRHSGAANCLVTVWQQESLLQLLIDDDGIGIANASNTGNGITGMRERVEEVGGQLTVTNRLEGGTRVAARVPLGRSE